jgi:hypothetical protein
MIDTNFLKMSVQKSLTGSGSAISREFRHV